MYASTLANGQESTYLSCAETAKLVRTALKEAFPSMKFSVRSDNYSGGASMRVAWTDGPTEEEVNHITRQYKGADFDGMIDLKTYNKHWMLPDGTVQLAHVEDTSSARGTITGVKYAKPHPQARLVHMGADFIFCNRAYSPEFIKPIAERESALWGFPCPEVKRSDYSGEAIIDEDYTQKIGNDPLAWYIMRKAREISGLTSRGRIKTARELAETPADQQAAPADQAPAKKERKPIDREKLRTLAGNMEAQIEERMSPRLENTSRRANMAASIRRDGERLKDIQAVLYYLGETECPGPLEWVCTRSQVETLYDWQAWPGAEWSEDKRASLRKAGIDEMNYADVRAYMMGVISEKRGAMAKDPDAEKLRELIRDIKFRPIAGYFPTLAPLVSQMLDLASIEPWMEVLEPSAGKGDIADAIRDACPSVSLDVCEWNASLHQILKLKGHNVIAGDFLSIGPAGTDGYIAKSYDRIVMNPPFENGQDVEHVRHAYDMLKPGGALVAIMSAGTFFNMTTRCADFRNWLDSVDGVNEKLPENSFKDSDRPTAVNAHIVYIEKNTGASVPTPTPEPDLVLPDPIPDADPGTETCETCSNIYPDVFEVCPVCEALHDVDEYEPQPLDIPSTYTHNGIIYHEVTKKDQERIECGHCPGHAATKCVHAGGGPPFWYFCDSCFASYCEQRGTPNQDPMTPQPEPGSDHATDGSTALAADSRDTIQRSERADSAEGATVTAPARRMLQSLNNLTRLKEPQPQTRPGPRPGGDPQAALVACMEAEIPALQLLRDRLEAYDLVEASTHATEIIRAILCHSDAIIKQRNGIGIG